MGKSLKILILIICIIFCRLIEPQTSNSKISKEIGRPFINFYGPKDYKSEPENFAILKDSRGIIYDANNSGNILEFDGTGWRHIILPNQLPVESLAEDEKGRIYVGGTKDFGYLKPDSNGNLHFQSLLQYVKKEDRIFTDVITVIATPDGIYFQTQFQLFRWKNSMLKVWKSHTKFLNSFWIYHNLYIFQNGIGLMIMKNDTLRLAPGGDIFINRPVQAMLPYNKRSFSADKHQEEINKLILLDIAKEGLFLFNGKSLQTFTGAANEFVKRNGIRCSAALNDTTFAIGTLQNGAVIFNSKGDITQLIDQNSGQAYNIVYSISTSSKGGIWMAMQQGVAYMADIHSRFSIYDQGNGLDGVVLALPAPMRLNGILYISTTTGVYYLDPKRNRFNMVSGLVGDFWSLFKYGNSLFAVRESLRKIDGKSSSFVRMMDERVGSAQRSYIDSNRIYLGLKEGGFQVLQRENNKWVENRKIKGIYEFPRNMVEEPNGDVWFGDESDGLIYVHFSSDKENPHVQRFGAEDGLPPGRMYAYRTSLHPVFSSSRGLFRFNSNTGKFIPDTTFGNQLSNGSLGTGFLSEDKKGNIWVSVFDGTNYYLNVSRPQPDGTFSLESAAFLGMPSTGIWTIYPEDNGIIWYGGEDGLIRYDDNLPKNKQLNFHSYIRRVTANRDSVIYGGSLPENGKLSSVELTYTYNALQFDYAAVFYNNPNQNRYRVFLEGFDKGWSNWMYETGKDYTNLPDGQYIFHVQAKNIFGYESSEDDFAFTIFPPWYRKWWAFLLYGIVFLSFFGLVVYGYSKWRTRQLRHRTEELEKIVASRTAELSEKNFELQELSTIKSRFFANISHEFRTPLTLILGQIESLLPDLKKEHNINRAKMALRNSRLLQRLINQLLDLSKFDAKEMKLYALEQNIVPLLKHLTHSFESLAAQREIGLGFESIQENIQVYFDQDKIEKVMHNLLSNAIKFTKNGGNVSVSVESDPNPNEHRMQKPSSDEVGGDVKIIVHDSGIGIPKDRLPRIFDRFFQVDNSTTREYEGTGIGLALTKELVQIHGGGISVESREGFGTTFTILLPLGKAHLKPAQIGTPETGISGLSEPDFEIIPETIENIDPKESDQPVIQNNKSKIILVVEDNPDMRAYINETLVINYNIMEASNGEEGLNKAVEEIPDLIITDVMMPQMDGYELTRKLRKTQTTSHIPIIMLTAKAAESDKLEGLETGVDAFLIKPFSTKELQIRVRKLIEIREQLKKQIGSKAVLTPSDLSVSSMDQQFLKRMHDIIEEGLGDENFSVDNLADGIGIGIRQLQRKLKALTDCTPAQCIRVMRLRRAKQLLEQGAGNVSQVAFRVGYSDVTAFSRAFKEEFNILPSILIIKP